MVLIEKDLKKRYVWVDYQWTPWDNTVAYRPLNSTTTVNDQSGNGYTLTQTWGSFTTLDWVDCFYNGWSTTGYFTLESAPLIPIGNSDRTISLWLNPTTYSTSYDNAPLSYWNRSISWDAVYMRIDTSGNYLAGVQTENINWSSMIANSWTLLTFTSSWNTFSFYINWVLQGSNSDATISTAAISSSYPFYLMKLASTSSHQVRWYLSEVIIEDKNWTATEILNYFNDNKAKYWLS